MLDLNSGSRIIREFSEESLMEYVRCLTAGEIKTIIILGRVRSGKTTKLLKLIDCISDLGLHVGGICQP